MNKAITWILDSIVFFFVLQLPLDIQSFIYKARGRLNLADFRNDWNSMTAWQGKWKFPCSSDNEQDSVFLIFCFGYGFFPSISNGFATRTAFPLFSNGVLLWDHVLDSWDRPDVRAQLYSNTHCISNFHNKVYLNIVEYLLVSWFKKNSGGDSLAEMKHTDFKSKSHRAVEFSCSRDLHQ